METDRVKLLLIEDNPGDARLIRETLRLAGAEHFDLQQADRLATGLARLDEGGIALVLLDLSLPDSQGLDTVAGVRAHAPETPIVVLTGLDDEALALKALEIGAQDYLVKGDLDGRSLSRAIRYAIERQRVERALRQSEARFRGLLASAPDAILIVSREGRITFANEQVEKTFGYRPNELVGQAIERLVPGGARERHGQHRLSYLAAPRARPMDTNLDLRGRRQDGSEFDADIMLGPVEQDGELSVLVIVRDVTERKAAQAALIAKTAEIEAMTQQLWQAAKLATMGELAASIAHELNNPLMTVSLSVELLQAQLAADAPQRPALEIIEQEVDRMAALVANLLQSSRRNVAAISSVDIRDEISKTLELLEFHLRRQRIAVVKAFAPDMALIHADRQLLRQLFLNLCTNAGDAMPDGGTLTLRAGKEGDMVRVEIVDTGQGIAPDNLPRVMDPFFTTKPEGKGTGLGLAICRRIVQEHGGTLEISSAGVPGLGTTVRISLPVRGPVQEHGLIAESEPLPPPANGESGG